jgi:hypothetical protein
VKCKRPNDRVSQAMSVTYRPSLHNHDVVEPPIDAFTPQHPFNRLERRACQLLSGDLPTVPDDDAVRV